MGRPKKPAGSRARDQLHVGWRLTDQQTVMMDAVMSAKRLRLAAMGVPSAGVTVSGLARVWLEERLLREWQDCSSGTDVTRTEGTR